MRLITKERELLDTTLDKNGKTLWYLEVSEGYRKWASRNEVLNLIHSGLLSNATLRYNQICYLEPTYRVEKLNLKNIDKLRSYVESKLSENNGYYLDEDYYLNSLYESLQRDISSYNLYIVFYGNKITSLFYYDDSNFGIPFFYMTYTVSNKDAVEGVKIISKEVKGSIFFFDSLNISLSEFGNFEYVQRFSTKLQGYRYIFHSGSYITEYDTKNWVNEIDKKYLPDVIDIKRLKFVCIDNIEMKKYIDGLRYGDFDGFWSEASNIPSVVGFKYLKFEEMFGHKQGDIRKYLVAVYNGVIVGVLHFGVWSGEQSLSYIDIMKNNQHKGIATLLLKEYNKYIDRSNYLYITRESQEGKVAKMHELCKKYLVNVDLRFSN